MGSLHPAIDRISGLLIVHDARALSKKVVERFCLRQFVGQIE
jgi:hypothetical protein